MEPTVVPASQSEHSVPSATMTPSPKTSSKASRPKTISVLMSTSMSKSPSISTKDLSPKKKKDALKQKKAKRVFQSHRPCEPQKVHISLPSPILEESLRDILGPDSLSEAGEVDHFLRLKPRHWYQACHHLMTTLRLMLSLGRPWPILALFLLGGQQ